MKKTNLTILGLGLCLSFFAIPLKAQDEKPTKVTITITENDMVTTDTTFELKGSQDPEMITQIVAKLTGEDIHGKHEKVMIFESLDSAGHHVIKSKDHHVMVVTDEGDHEGEVKVFVSSLDPDEEGKTMKKTKKQLLELIEVWLGKFPCWHFFKRANCRSCCILEFITAKEVFDFIEKKHKQYKKT